MLSRAGKRQLEDVSPVIQEASSVLNPEGGGQDIEPTVGAVTCDLLMNQGLKKGRQPHCVVAF